MLLSHNAVNLMLGAAYVATVIRARSYVVVYLRLGYLISSESIEALIGVADERQTHLSSNVIALLRSLGTQSGAGIILINFVNGKVLRIHVGLQFRLEWRTDPT
jgi:hypothetical protein